MADTTTNISLTKPTATDTTKIREDINSNSDLIDAQFAATYLAPQLVNSVAITGGSIVGITDLAVADGGTGVSTLTDGGVLLGSGTGAITAMAVLTDGQMIVGNGTTDPVAESGATLRTSIGVAIGTNVQAYDAQLDDIAALTVIDGNIIVGDGTNWVAESGDTARASLGLTIGTDVQAEDATLTALAGLTISANSLIYGTGADAFSVLATNATATNKFLREVSSGAPSWEILEAGDIPDISATYQPLDTALTNISALTYVSPSFIKLTENDTYAVRTLDEVATDLGLNPSKTLIISSSGGDYTTIQAALTANSAGGELFIVYPGTYTNDTIAFTANNQSVVGYTNPPNRVLLTHTETICDFGAYTGCIVKNIKMLMTVTAKDDVVTGTGSCNFLFCHTECAASGTIADDSPTCYNISGTSKIVEGSIVYANTATSTGKIKSAVNVGAGGAIIIDDVNITVTGSGACTGIVGVFDATTGTFDIDKCTIDVDDDGATFTAAMAVINGSGEYEFNYNVVHVTNDVGTAVVLYAESDGNALTFRSSFNHLHAVSSGGTAYSLLIADADTTVISQLDDIIAANGASVTGGTLTEVNSLSDGELSASSKIDTDTIAEYTADTGVTIDGVVLKDSLISPVYGGTGVANNAANTLTFTGAYSLGLTLSANTAVTLPTTGTLATLAGTETFTNKTLTSPKLNEDVAVTTTATKLNYITNATGTTGTDTTNIVFSTSPTLVTPVINHNVTTSATTNTLTVAESGLVLVSDTHTETLPTAVGNSGLIYTIKKTDDDTDLITIDADGTETIDGELTYTELYYQYAYVMLMSDNANWQIIGESTVKGGTF